MSDPLQIAKIAKLELAEGDILLVSVPASWSDQRIGNIGHAIQHALNASGKQNKLLCGPDTIKFQVVRKEKPTT